MEARKDGAKLVRDINYYGRRVAGGRAGSGVCRRKKEAGQSGGGIDEAGPLYLRVLGALHREARLAWILAIANLALAAAQFAEPVLFGRVIDTLTGASGSDAESGHG